MRFGEVITATLPETGPSFIALNIYNLCIFQNCFRVNGVNGRHLIRLDATLLPSMGVNDFNHIKVRPGPRTVTHTGCKIG